MKGLRAWVLILCLGLISLAFAADVRSALEQAESLARQARSASQAQRDKLLERAKNALNPLSPEARAPLEVLLDDAKRSDSALEQALSTLESYREVLEPYSHDFSREAVRQQVEAIYAEPDMQIPDEPWLARIGRLLNQMLEQVIRWIMSLLGGLGGAGGGAGVVAQWIVIALLIALLGLLISYVANYYQQRPRRTQRTAIDISEIQDARVLTADEWAQLAQQLANEGNLKGSVRALYLGLLRLLSEHRVLEYDPARTNWEHLQQLRAQTDRTYYQTMAPLTLRFDLLWYGGVDAERADYQQFEEAFRTLTARLSQNARATA